MLPFEFIVVGTPVSHQSKNKKRIRAWKSQILSAAQSRWPPTTPPLTCEITLEITYFYDTAAPDVDNIIKPVQDALIGLVYHDDAAVTRTSSRKSRLDGAFRVRGVSTELASALAIGNEFLRVRVLPGPEHEDLS